MNSIKPISSPTPTYQVKTTTPASEQEQNAAERDLKKKKSPASSKESGENKVENSNPEVEGALTNDLTRQPIDSGRVIELLSNAHPSTNAKIDTSNASQKSKAFRRNVIDGTKVNKIL